MEETTTAIDRTEYNPEPDWSFAMFWEDITAILVRIFDMIRSAFNYI